MVDRRHRRRRHGAPPSASPGPARWSVTWAFPMVQHNMVLTMIDVDGLKIVNDTVGDALRGVAEASSTMRSYDVFAR